MSDDEVQRSLGRIEGSVSALTSAVTSLQMVATAVQSGVATIVQDNLQCHTDRLDHGKRLAKVEHRQFWVAGASSTIGLVLGWFAHLLGFTPH